VKRPLAAALCLFSASSVLAADLTIENTRAAGFNDPTPATPLPMNPGTNRGDQALIVFQAVTAMWGATVKSSVPIPIDSEFDSVTTDSTFACSANGTVLAFTSPGGALSGPTFPNTQAAYVAPLANAIAGQNVFGPGPQFTVNINADLGTQKCDFPASWYFGLDTNIPDSAISLFTTLLHEFGHGLGFFSFVDPSTGEAQDFAIFDYHVFDLDAGATWANDSVAVRAKLITTPSSIAFDGDAVRADIPTYLARPPTLLTTFDAVTTSRNFAQGEFSGPAVGSGPLVASVPLDACSDLTNRSDVNGKFALIERSFGDAGTVCSFLSKAERAADAGAIGVIVFDTAPEALIQMAGTPALDIPADFISNGDGKTLQNELAEGPVTVSFGTAAQISNTDITGTRVLLYTPPQVSSGSSVSHWNSNSYPHTLLLEFANQDDIRLNMDFTPDVMSDLGWQVVNGLTVAVVKLLDPEVPAGAQFSYLTAILNRRGTPITDVVLDLALPTGTTFVSNTSSPAGCTGAFPCDLGAMQAGEVLLVITTVQASATAASPFVATATLTPSSADGADNLTASSTQTTASGGDVQVTVTGPASVSPGVPATLTTTLTNQGPGDAAGIVLTGTVSGTASSPPVLASTIGGVCTGFPCEIGTLTKGQTVTVQSNFTIPAGFQNGATFTATVTAATPDSNSANNTATFAFSTGGSSSSGCSSTGGPVTVLGLVGLALALGLRRRATA
jgi:uncharacterized repeat protein (TIGR01451 family)/MYXO-CTERM domain-containing protein